MGTTIIPQIHIKYHAVGRLALNDDVIHESVHFPPLSKSFSEGRLQLCSSHAIKKVDNYAILILGHITDVLDTHITVGDYRRFPELTIIRLFKDHKERFTSLLEGFFLIVLYDTAKHESFIFNNRYQATQCYYCSQNGALFFATSLKLLLKALPATPPFDLRALPSFLHTGFSHTEKTQFEGINRLLPTQHLHVKTNDFVLADHWRTEYIFDRRPFTDLEAKLGEYETIFRNSIQGFLDTAQPRELGCFVSGGHDTSYIFLQACKLYHKPIHAFTASFKNFGFDEAPKSRYLTEKFGGIHHTVYIGPQSLDLIPLMINCIEEPVSGGAFPIFACVFDAQKYVEAMLSGDAGDSLWGEYYPVHEWHKYLRALPVVVRKSIKGINRLLRNLTDWERLWESDHVFSLFAEKNMYKDLFARLCSYRHYDHQFLRDLLDPNIFKDIVPYTCMIDIPFTKDNMFDALVEAKMLYGLCQYMMPPTQKPLETFGVDYYAPYLNHTLITFINSLPENWLNGGSSFKKLINDAHRRKFHKLAMLRYLPKRYVYSAQQSLDVPFHSFLTKRPYVLENLLTRLKRRGLFNNKTLDRIFYEFPRQKVKPHEIIELKHHGYRLFCLLTFEIWCMQFIDNDKENHIPSKEIIPLNEYLA
ncbi:MAG: hypothetical protein JW938_01925 [Candidatus Omnitrophica bacterium]|nr:hypothetical protein [Candidatus Omnitrophota bacterium]